MPHLDISELADDSRIWIFGISPALDRAREPRLLSAVDSFLDEWSAHGVPVVCARDILSGSFLVIAVDRRSETSGCSIDRMFGLLRQLERELNISILEANRVFYRGADRSVRAVSRDRFRELAEPDTIVFDTLAERLGELRSGRWERPATDSWHRSLLPVRAISET